MIQTKRTLLLALAGRCWEGRKGIRKEKLRGNRKDPCIYLGRGQEELRVGGAQSRRLGPAQGRVGFLTPRGCPF